MQQAIKKTRPLPAGSDRESQGEGAFAICALRRGLLLEPARANPGYQVRRGPTNHCVSPSETLTSPATPQFGVNFTCAPRRP